MFFKASYLISWTIDGQCVYPNCLKLFTISPCNLNLAECSMKGSEQYFNTKFI